MKKAMGAILRNFLSCLPSIGLVSKPAFRENGISAIIPTANDEWVEPSLRSLKHFADEIIIVDSSTDNTPNVIRKVASQERLNLRLIKYKDESNSIIYRRDTLAEKLNIALQNTRYKWISKWHSDFIARTSGKAAPNCVKARVKFCVLPGRVSTVQHQVVRWHRVLPRPAEQVSYITYFSRLITLTLAEGLLGFVDESVCPGYPGR